MERTNSLLELTTEELYDVISDLQVRCVELIRERDELKHDHGSLQAKNAGIESSVLHLSTLVDELQAEVDAVKLSLVTVNNTANKLEKLLAHAQSCAVSMEAVCNIASEISLLNESEESDGEDDYTIQFELMPKLQAALREWRLKRNAQSQPLPLASEPT